MKPDSSGIDRLVLSLMLSCAVATASEPPEFVRASVSDRGIQGDGLSVRPELRADGEAMLFISMASTLAEVRGFSMNIYLRDLRTGRTSVMSVDADGHPLGDSTDPAWSGDGSLVAFASMARNVRQIHVRGPRKRRLAIASVSDAGEMGNGDSATPAVSFDGSVLAFASAATNLAPGCTVALGNIVVRKLATASTGCVSLGYDGRAANGPSDQPTVSGDGRFVAFRSTASNLVRGDANGVGDIFVRDLHTGITTVVSVPDGDKRRPVANGPSMQPSLSHDGHRIAFVSHASNLVRGDTNAVEDVFLRDRHRGTTLLVSIGPSGARADAHSAQPRISGNGRFVVFLSPSATLAGKHGRVKSQIFRRDIEQASAHLVSIGLDGAPALGNSFQPAISHDGTVIAFRSNAANLVEGDSNLTDDVFYVRCEARAAQ